MHSAPSQRKTRRLLNLAISCSLLVVGLSLGNIVFVIPAYFYIVTVLATLGLGVAISARCAVADMYIAMQHAQEMAAQLTALENQLNKATMESADSARAYQQEFARRSALLQAVPFPVFYKDTTGVYLEVNPAWESFFQLSAASLGNQTVSQLFPRAPEMARYQMQQEDALLKDGVPYLRYELSLPMHNGEPHKLICHLAPCKDAGGKTVGVVGVIVDISDNLRTEATLAAANAELLAANQRIQQAQEQLVQSEKMACIGQLAAGVAHEINNPMGYVYSNLNALDRYMHDLFTLLSLYEGAENGIADPQQRALIDKEKQRAEIVYLREDLPNLLLESREGLERVKKIVQDLKDFSRKSSDDEAWQITDLHKCLDSTINIVWNELKYKCTLQREYASLPEIECLPSQLNQVIMNMLVNAGHAIEERGTITVSTGLVDDAVWIAIKDTGKGIAAENLNRIFDPFFTTKPVGQGTGLGLALSYSIIQKHNGRIEVHSEVGVGTTFRIWLPCHHIEHAEAA